MNTPIESALVLVTCTHCRLLHEAPLTDRANPICPPCAAAVAAATPPERLLLR